MKRLHSILTLLLLAASAMSLLAAQASTAPGIHDEKPAGCHEHGKKAPVHPASDYACCVAGHGSALVQASFVPQPQQVSAAFVLTVPALHRSWRDGFAGLFRHTSQADSAAHLNFTTHISRGIAGHTVCVLVRVALLKPE